MAKPCTNCTNQICAQLGVHQIVNISCALKLQDRFELDHDGPPSARRQRVDSNVELDEARSRFSELEIEKTRTNLKKFYHLGQDCSTDNIQEVMDILLKRDVPEIYDLTEDNPDLKEMVCIPKEFIPRVPTISALDT